MSLAKRAPSKFEKLLLTYRSDTQFAIELEDPKLVPEYVERFQKNMLGLHVSFDGENLMSKDKLEDPIKLPSTSTIQEASDWLGRNMLPFEKSIGTIAYNDRFVIVSCNHTAGDGGTYTQLINNIQNPNCDIKLPPLPEPIEKTFENEIAKTDVDFEYFNLNKLTRASSKDENLPKQSFDVFTKSQIFKEPVQNLITYNQNTKKCDGLTDSVWLGLCLSMCALNDKLGPIGCATCTDLRYLINPGPQHVNTFSIIWPNVPVSPLQTIEELGKSMKEEFNWRKKRGDVFAYFHKDRKIIPAPGSLAEISQIPPIHIKKPITDTWVQITLRDYDNDCLSLLGQSLINDTTGTNTYAGRLRYVPSQLTDKDALKISEGIRMFMQNIPKTMKVGDAFEELKAFQKGI